MNTTYRDAVAAAGGALITHIGLVDELGTEVVGGSYARLAVTWAAPVSGVIRPTANLEFDVPIGNIGGWRGYDALTMGTDYGGATFFVVYSFSEAGVFRLLAAETGIPHTVGGA